MIAELASASPNSSMGAEARTFDRFVGTWDSDFSFRTTDGSFRHKRGEVIFGWVLDGRAVQDLWITYPAAGEKWRVVFVNPQFNYVVNVQGGVVGDRIVMTGLERTALKSDGRSTTSRPSRSCGTAKLREMAAKRGCLKRSIT